MSSDTEQPQDVYKASWRVSSDALSGASCAHSPSQKYTVDFNGELLYIDATNWRHSGLLKLQILAAYCMFVLFGLAEQAVGTLIPIFQKEYRINDVQTSFIFLSSVMGYFTMAFINEQSHRLLGIRGVLTLGASSMTIAYLIVSLRPPFLVLVFCYIMNGIGFGSLDASLNAWMGKLADLNQLLGILHGCYGIGCMVSPPLITHLVERKKNPWQWNQYYLVLCTVGAVCVAQFIVFFRFETPQKYHYSVSSSPSIPLADMAMNDSPDAENAEISEDPAEENAPENTPNATFSETILSRLIWVLLFILFIYVGGEVAFGSWLVSFLMRIKDLPYKYSSYMATAFWLGLTVGRIGLGFVTAHYFSNELTANLVYLGGSLGGLLMFWFLALGPWNAVLFPVVFVTGLFIGPIFPTHIVVSINILPVKFHALGLGLVCAFGGGGAAVLPFIVGLVADNSDLGLRLFPLIVVVVFAMLTAMWLGLMRRFKSTYKRNVLH